MRKGHYLKDGQKLWLHFSGRTFVVDLDKPEAPSPGAKSKISVTPKSTFEKIIRSPMPGKVLKVNCKPGDSVTKGKTLIVLEAMKMEYALKATGDSKVKSVLTTEGQQVLLDEILVELE